MDKVWWWGCRIAPVTMVGIWWYVVVGEYSGIYMYIIYIIYIYIYVVFPSPSPKSFQHWSKTFQNHQKSKGNYPKKQPLHTAKIFPCFPASIGLRLDISWEKPNGWASVLEGFRDRSLVPKAGDGGVLLEKLQDFLMIWQYHQQFPFSSLDVMNLEEGINMFCTSFPTNYSQSIRFIMYRYPTSSQKLHTSFQLTIPTMAPCGETPRLQRWKDHNGLVSTPCCIACLYPSSPSAPSKATPAKLSEQKGGGVGCHVGCGVGRFEGCCVTLG